jgi:AcrR family transcriptional regulator
VLTVSGTQKTIRARAKAAPAGKRRVGRPRANGEESSSSPREDILRVAGHLFAERGFLGTSTLQIAAAAGLRQSAIFHWFPSKESILETLFARGWDRSLEFFARVEASELPGAVKFCLCVTYDARLVAGSEPHIQLMMVPTELRQPRFKRLLRKRQRLIAYLEGFIHQAMSDGDFRQLDAEQTARMVLAADEVVLDAARSRRRRSPQTHADSVIDFALHALVADRGRVAPILRAVADYDAALA